VFCCCCYYYIKLYTKANWIFDVTCCVVDCWSEALALQASPTEAPYAFENTSKIADIVWRYAGDRSSDFTWYSKRAILMGIYTGAEVYLLADKSEDAKDTFDFIERGVRDLVV